MQKRKIRRAPLDKYTRHQSPRQTLSITPPKYRDEWEQHKEQFADAGGFEDDPVAAVSDNNGRYDRRSLGVDGIQSITGVDVLWGNGESTG